MFSNVKLMNTYEINLPDHIVESINRLIEGTSYKSTVDFVEKKISKLFPEPLNYTEREEDIIRRRLRKLGYLE